MKGIKALAIDDEAIVLESIRKVLGAEGMDISTTMDGREGIQLAVERPFNIVMTDIRMPDVDGLTVLWEIKQVKPTIPVLIITGFATISSAVQAMKLGAINYLEKPFTPEELVRAVVSAIETSTSTIQEEQTLIHTKEVLKVLKKGASDSAFAGRVFEAGVEALSDYNLTRNEKLAIITGDVNWIEDQIGIIGLDRKNWLIEGKKKLKG